MTISELIEKLEAIKREYGDLDVYRYDYDIEDWPEAEVKYIKVKKELGDLPTRAYLY